ncbi:MAG TPA: hypothetical protein V6C95_08530 [Coleofasciculaceae cyanobacterium]
MPSTQEVKELLALQYEVITTTFSIASFSEARQSADTAGVEKVKLEIREILQFCIALLT